MKLYKIEMKDVYQFQNMEIDLTYPDGHPTKAGQPLDKVCIIGQSGTGKTKLLKLIRDSIEKALPSNALLSLIADDEKPKSFLPKVELFFRKEEVDFSINTFLSGSPFHNSLQINCDIIFPNAKSVDDYSFLEKYTESLPPLAVLFYPHNLSSDRNSDVRNLNHAIIDFEQINIGAAWRGIVQNIKKYRTTRFLESDKFAQASSKEPDKAKEYSILFQKWKDENPNPLERLAKELDKILEIFYLKIKLENTENTIEHLDSIPVQHLISGKEFNYEDLSTGTQRIINTGIPLYQLKPQDAIIIFDEVENSLYPDIQKIIIDYYTSLAPSCQFFFATHSPIIASNFEPWEIVELKFNEQGKVYREEYYKGERHVDNYFIHPKLLRWDEILTDVFDLKVEGNEERNKKLQELANLEVQIAALKARKASEGEVEEKINEYKKVASILNWRIDESN